MTRRKPRQLSFLPLDNELPPEATSPITRIVNLFHDLHVAQLGHKPLGPYGFFTKRLKAMLRVWSEDDLCALVREFFTTADSHVVSSDYSVNAFLHHAPRLMVRINRGAVDRRTAENRDAALRAMGKH